MNKTLKRFLLILSGGIGIYVIYNAITKSNTQSSDGYEPYIPVPLDVDPDIDIPDDETPQEVD